MKAKFGFTLWVIMLLSLAGASSAEQLVRAGYPGFAAPLTSLPGFTPKATLDNGGLDPSRVEGALIDLMNAVAKDARLQLQFVLVPGPEQIAALNSKIIDLSLLFNQVDSDIDANTTQPLYQDSEALVVKKTDEKQYTTWEDLRGEVIVACGGAANAAQQSGIFKQVRVVGCGEVPQAVRDPEIKAGIKGSLIDTLYAQQHGVYEPDIQMSMSYQPRFVIQRSMATRKGDALLSTINMSLEKLKNDGTLKMIFTKYGIEGSLVK